MRVRLSRQLRNFLKIALRKSSVLVISISLFSVVLPAGVVQALEIDPALHAHNNTLALTLTLEQFPVSEVESVFRTGQTSQIQFEVRVFKETHGMWSMLGDELLEEKRVTYIGRYDPFNESYRIETDGTIKQFVDAGTFFRAFRTVFISFDLPHADPRDIYVRARAKLTPRKLMPPLNLLEPFLLDNQKTTGWVHMHHPHGEQG